MIEAHTAWLAKAPSSASRGSGAAVGEFSSLRMDMGRLQHRVAQLQLTTDETSQGLALVVNQVVSLRGVLEMHEEEHDDTIACCVQAQESLSAVAMKY